MATNQRGTVLSLRLTDAEQQRLRAAAEARDTTVSEYVRAVINRDVATGKIVQDIKTESIAVESPQHGIFVQGQVTQVNRGTIQVGVTGSGVHSY